MSPEAWRAQKPLATALLTIGLLATALSLAPAPPLLHSSAAAATTAVVGDQAGFSPGAGINLLSDSQIAIQMNQMAAAGTSWVRLDINWAQIESTPGTYDWHIPDTTIAAARAAGLNVLGLLSYAPGWAFNPNAPTGTPPVVPSQFATFASAAAARYAPQGVTHWEIWNEPNLQSFWGKTPNVGEYTQVLTAASAGIHATNPAATVLSGGLAPAADTASTISPLTFVQAMYASGANTSFDAIAIHPYSYPELPLFNAPWNPFRVGMPAIHDVMVANGDGAKQVWPTEYGAATGTHSRAVNETAQRNMIVEALTCAAAHTWIGPIFVYNLADPANGSLNDLEDNFGLLRSNGTAKSSWFGIQQKTAEPVSTQTCPELTRDLCNGLIVTVNLALGQSPTNGPDVILGTAGSDTINGLGGNDTICGLDGTDRIDAGTGNDWVDGGLGIDRIWGRSGADTINGGGGSDRIWAGDGNDSVFAGSGADRVYGGPGDDQLYGMGGQDRIRGEADDDVIQGSHQSDDLWGGAGDDTIRGARGKDVLWGGLGNDDLFGGDNTDVLRGDGGSDHHDGQRGSDICISDGNPGDTFTSC